MLIHSDQFEQLPLTLSKSAQVEWQCVEAHAAHMRRLPAIVDHESMLGICCKQHAMMQITLCDMRR